MADNTTLNAGSGGDVMSTDDIGGGIKVQRVKMQFGVDGSATDVSSSNPLPMIGLTTAEGAVAHGSTENGQPMSLGGFAVAHGSSPSAVDAADRVRLIANRHGIPYVIGGHPNVVSYGMSVTTAISNTVIGPTVSSGSKLVVTGLTVTADNANTVFPSIVIGFGTSTTPAFAGTPGTAKVIGGHPGVPAGGGFNRGDGHGIVGVGADNEELRVTTVGNVTGLYLVMQGYTIES